MIEHHVPVEAQEPSAAVRRGPAAVAGMLAALAALGAGELVAGLPGSGDSLVASVGTAFIDRFAGPLKDAAVAVFGTNDKAALIVGIVVVSAGLGAATGVLARTREWIGPAVFGAFGLVGVLAGVNDPQAEVAVVVVAAVVAVLTGVTVLRLLLRAAATGDPFRRTRSVPVAEREPGRAVEYPTDPRATRRAFFGWAGAAGAFAVVSAGAGRLLTGRSQAEAARAGIRLPPADRSGAAGPAPGARGPFDVDGLTPYYMPNDDFYRIDTALVVPQVDPATWRLRITGMVDHPFELTFDELLKLPMVEEAVTLSCVSNEVGGDLVGNARWQGVPLRALLDRAGVQRDATQIVGVSTDGFTAGFPTVVGLDGRVALVAVGMNGEPLPVRHGFPARLVVSGLYGYVSATKWLQEIRLTRLEDFDGYWIDKGWAKQAPIKTQSRIDVPKGSVRPGPVKIAGVAWAPVRGISRVEVQVDGGPWQEARLGEVVSRNTWVQWVLDWDAPTGEHEIRCRATDGAGATQTDAVAPPDPDGATGWHTRRVVVR